MRYFCTNIKNLTTIIAIHTRSYVYLRFILLLFTTELVCARVRGPLTRVQGPLLGLIQLGPMDRVPSSRPGWGRVRGPIPKREHAYIGLVGRNYSVLLTVLACLNLHGNLCVLLHGMGCVSRGVWKVIQLLWPWLTVELCTAVFWQLWWPSLSCQCSQGAICM